MLNYKQTRLIILAVVLIFCDSHENQIDDISLSSSSSLTTTATTDDGIPVDENLIESDDMKNFSTIEFEMNKTAKLGKKIESWMILGFSCSRFFLLFFLLLTASCVLMFIQR